METIKLKLGDKLYKAIPSNETVHCLEYTVIEIRQSPAGDQYILESTKVEHHPSAHILVGVEEDRVRYIGWIKRKDGLCPNTERCWHTTCKKEQFKGTPQEAMGVYVQYLSGKKVKEISKLRDSIERKQQRITKITEEITVLQAMVRVGVAPQPAQTPSKAT